MSWFGRMVLRTGDRERVVLVRSIWPSLGGWAVALTSLVGAVVTLPLSRAVAIAFVALAGLGLLVATARRRIVVDTRDGVVRVEERWLGVPLRRVVPLFHVRAVMVVPRGDGFTAYLQLRVGDHIELDDARSPARLLRLARALTDATDWRLIYQRAS